jgi:hypothetical protein
MPEINLPQNFSENPSASLNAGNIILSYMVHPNDEQKRDEFLKLSNLDLKHRLEDEPISKELSDQVPILIQNPHLAKALRKQAVATTVDPYFILPENAERFLLKINANSVLREMFEPHIQQSWATVHHILLTMMRVERYLPQIRGGASVSKAVAFLDHMKKPNVMTNKTDMMVAWKNYKNIAHYLFPFYLMYSDPEKNSFCHIYDPSGIKGFLVLAGNVQKWMLTLKPSHNKQDKLFEKRKLWVIPSRYKVSDFHFHIAPFTDEELSVIKDYKRF